MIFEMAFNPVGEQTKPVVRRKSSGFDKVLGKNLISDPSLPQRPVKQFFNV